jgi:hypothetical protein
LQVFEVAAGIHIGGLAPPFTSVKRRRWTVQEVDIANAIRMGSTSF